ncbi:MAG TPA: peptidoglycan-binding domain-containing protein [Reyranella sp.]|jgi:hypothetical protein|nr:peptidoglycan-binding domain-containing protein [Reyranella sp.]
MRHDTATAESDEAFKQSLAEFSHQLASRKVAEPPEFPIAPEDDNPDARGRRSRWHRPAIVTALIVALFAGFYSFRVSAPTPSALPPPSVAGVLPPPPATVPPPTVKDFAALPLPAETLLAIAPPPPPAETQPPAEYAPLDRKGIQEVQTRLQSIGLSPGPIDGVAGRLTQSAVRRYQESKGQPATGKVDSSLLKRLRDDSAAR